MPGALPPLPFFFSGGGTGAPVEAPHILLGGAKDGGKA